jgi:lipopolysaccharide transport system ATP-binding protein
MKIKTEKLSKGETAEVNWVMNFPLQAGTYSFSVGVANRGFDWGSFEEYLFLSHEVNIITVISNSQSIIYSGIFNMIPEVDVVYKF